MRHFGLQGVADAPPEVISTYAGMLGLIAAPPELGNYDATWSALHRKRPDN